MKHLALASLGLFATACERQEQAARSIEDPAQYRPATPQDQNGRAIFNAGLSLPVPKDAGVVYPQGIDSRLMHLSGQGYTLQLDDYGAFIGSATALVAGAPAVLEDRSRKGCKFRIWRVQLPGTSPTNLICSRGNPRDCKQAPAQATIATSCTSTRACRQVDEIIAGARFALKPWPKVPPPSPETRPNEPACSP
jgi:hypothetical protein